MSLLRVIFGLSYLIVGIHTAYGGGWWSALGRGIFVFLSYSLIILATIILGALLAVAVTAG